MVWTIFEYLYRDAGNFKVFGCTSLEGRIEDVDRESIRAKLDSGELFIAEQIRVPALHGQLYRWSDGPTASDHCWHEFVAFRESDHSEGCLNAGSATDFVKRFVSVNEWDLSPSPHYFVG